MSDFWYRFGYDNIGVLYVGFVDWLRARMQEDGIDRAFFIARDGWIIQQVYERISGGAPSAYLYGSRRALNVPAITQLDAKALDFLTSGTSRMTVAQFIGRLGLSTDEHHEAIRRAGFDSADQPIEPGPDFQLLRRLYQTLSEPILGIAAGEREAMLGHLGAIGLLDCARPGLIDLGWHGTLQRSVERLLALARVAARPTGYYLGTFPPARELGNGGQRMIGYLCENGEPDRYYRIIRACVELFEFAFAAPHGSVLRMEAKQGAFEPVLAPHDSEPEDRRKAERAQEGALAFVDDWLRSGRGEISREAAVAPMERVLTRPTLLEARRLGDLRHAEGFGGVFVRRHIARPPALGALLQDPRALMEGLGESFWHEGYKTRVMGSNPMVRRFIKLAARGLKIRGY